MQEKVVVYSTATCRHCKTVKEYLSQKGIAYQEIDVGVDLVAREEMIRKTESTGVPTVLVGDNVVIGFDREKLDALLGS